MNFAQALAILITNSLQPSEKHPELPDVDGMIDAMKEGLAHLESLKQGEE